MPHYRCENCNTPKYLEPCKIKRLAGNPILCRKCWLLNNETKKVSANCLSCHKRFYPRKTYGKYAKHCSLKCSGRPGYKTVIKKCEFCNIEMETKENRLRSGRGRFCSTHCRSRCFGSGRKMSEQARENISKAIRGKKHWAWKGGRRSLRPIIQSCYKSRDWRKNIFERDNYTCVLCGARGGKLNVDHYPKAFAYILDDYNIQSLDDALNCPELWDTNNGRTLCVDCHRKTDNYGSKARISVRGSWSKGYFTKVI